MSTAAADPTENPPTNDEQRKDESVSKGGTNIELTTESELSTSEDIHDGKNRNMNEADKNENKDLIKANGEGDLSMDTSKIGMVHC